MMRTLRVLVAAAVGAASLVAALPGAAAAATSTAVTPSVTSINFGTQAVTDGAHVFGTPYTVTFTNGSGTSQTLGAASLTGADASHFQIVSGSDTCSNATLAAAGTCAITVKPNPVTVDVIYNATLTVPVTTDSGNTASVTLAATGAQDPPVWTQGGPGYVIVHWGTVPTVNGGTPTTYSVLRSSSPDMSGAAVLSAGAVGGGSYRDSAVIPNTTATPPTEYFYEVEPVVNNAIVITSPGVGAIPWEVGSAGTFIGQTPRRTLDTRTGLGAAKAPLTAGHVLKVRISGRAGVSASNAGAVVLNLTATNVSRSTAVTAWPDGKPMPTASVLNPGRGQTVANLVTVPINNGYIDLSGGPASLDLIADVYGYYLKTTDSNVTTSGQYFGFDPYRVEDTRLTGNGPLPGHFIDTIPSINIGADSAHVTAAIVHVTAFSAVSSGYLSVYNGFGEPPTNTSIVNYGRGTITSNLAIVPVASCEGEIQGCTADDLQIGVYNGGPHGIGLVVDVVGFIDDNNLEFGSTFKPMTPTRIVDTRVPQGLPGPIAPNTDAVVDPGSIAGYYTNAIDTNTTAVKPTKTTFFTVWPQGFTGLDRPTTSDLNASTGSVVPAHVIAQVGPQNKFNIYNNAGTTHAIVDVDGTFEFRPFPGGQGTLDALSVRHGVTVRTPKATVTGPARLPVRGHPEYRAG